MYEKRNWWVNRLVHLTVHIWKHIFLKIQTYSTVAVIILFYVENNNNLFLSCLSSIIIWKQKTQTSLTASNRNRQWIKEITNTKFLLLSIKKIIYFTLLYAYISDTLRYMKYELLCEEKEIDHYAISRNSLWEAGEISCHNPWVSIIYIMA